MERLLMNYPTCQTPRRKTGNFTRVIFFFCWCRNYFDAIGFKLSFLYLVFVSFAFSTQEKNLGDRFLWFLTQHKRFIIFFEEPSGHFFQETILFNRTAGVIWINWRKRKHTGREKKRIEYMGYGISVVDILTLGNIFYIIFKDFKKNRSTELLLTSWINFCYEGVNFSKITSTIYCIKIFV